MGKAAASRRHCRFTEAFINARTLLFCGVFTRLWGILLSDCSCRSLATLRYHWSSLSCSLVVSKYFTKFSRYQALLQEREFRWWISFFADEFNFSSVRYCSLSSQESWWKSAKWLDNSKLFFPHRTGRAKRRRKLGTFVTQEPFCGINFMLVHVSKYCNQFAVCHERIVQYVGVC
jgi:hypothetical protein